MRCSFWGLLIFVVVLNKDNFKKKLIREDKNYNEMY